jgi:16S rRNA (cytidine1402-2'-O)-methyltransferase
VTERREGATASRGRLFVVATPIGNLSDVTLRSLEVLREVPLIAAEDTRLTRRLLDRHKIATRTTSFHAQSGPGRLAELLAHLRGGADLALVTDAGTPSISDPGDDLVAAWAAEDGVVVPIPGASAVLAVVAASAVAGPRWSFEGFLPRSGRERRERIARIAADERGTVIYEAPGRVAATLVDLAAACGAERPAAIGRELTKLHEEVWRGTLAGALEWVAEQAPRGELVIVLDGAPPAGPVEDDALTAAVQARLDAGDSARDAAASVAASLGVARRRAYEAAVQITSGPEA